MSLESARHRRSRLRLALWSFGWIALLTTIARAAGLPERLTPDSKLALDLAAGETLSFDLVLTEGRPWRLAVDQIGIDVEVELRGPGGGLQLVADRPLDRDGTEYLLFRPEEPAGYRMEVRSRAAHAPPGRVRVAVEDLSWSTPTERARWVAERAETQAAAAYQRGGGDGRRRALEHFREALPHWTLSQDEAREAFATYSIAVLHRLLGEPEPALESAQRAEALFAELGMLRWQASTLNEIGLNRVAVGEYVEGRSAFEESLALIEKAPDAFRQAVAQSNVCLISLHLGELQAGIDCYRKAHPLYEAAGDPQSQAMALTNSGRAHDILGEPDRALASYEQALAVQRASGDLAGEALTLNNLAVLYGPRGDRQKSLALYSKAASIYRSLQTPGRLALVLSNTGAIYRNLGEVERARPFFEEALRLQQEAGDRRNEALTLSHLAELHQLGGDFDQARLLYENALALRTQIGDRKGEARSLYDLGRNRLEQGDPAAAEDLLERALTIAEEIGDRARAARTLHQLGRASARRSDFEGARLRLDRALEGYGSIGGRAGEAEVLTSLSGVARQRGETAEARRLVDLAVDRIESLRSEIASPELKAAFFATRREAYELDIDLWMDLHRAEPGAGHDARALASSERARARSLLDSLQDSALGAGTRLPPELAAEKRRLQHRLDAAERKRLRLASSSPAEAASAGHESAIQTILAEYDLLVARIRESNPLLAERIRPTVLDAREMRSLLSPETALLAYALGRDRSYLWWVTSEAVESFELPPEPAIERLARQVYQEISVLDSTASRPRRAAAELSRAVLGPIADRLDGQRLVIVADGALHYVPFAALPKPASDATGFDAPLILDHEVVHLPSVSALAAQRRLLATRPEASRLALVFADPVFGLDDPRLGAEHEPVAPPAETTDPGDRLDRLPATRREAEAIAALAPPESVRAVTGFAASRDAVVHGDLASYRVVHFATHGVIDDKTPLLSRLALSRVNEQGRQIEGDLRLEDVHALRLNAELVVLSGCKTAWGRQIRGEGLLGLTRAFMYAGAERVLAGLWQVQDRASAELMTRFYRGLWVDGLRPPAALRQAQMSMRLERRWQHPYYWAAFVLQGDWL